MLSTLHYWIIPYPTWPLGPPPDDPPWASPSARAPDREARVANMPHVLG